jgi:CBS domain-containing protein
MRAGDLMTRKFEVVHPDASVEDVWARLQATEAGTLPVAEGNRLIGVIRSREVSALVEAMNGKGRPRRVREALSPELYYCFEGTDAVEAGALMREFGLRSLPVLGNDYHLAGVLALESIADEIADDIAHDIAAPRSRLSGVE